MVATSVAWRALRGMRPRLIALAACFLLVACSASGGAGSSVPLSDPEAIDPAADGGDSGATSQATWQKGGPRATCERYLACALDDSPEILAPLLTAYGKEGSCWKERTEAECEAACSKALGRTANTRSLACNFCEKAADCDERTTSTCDLATRTCVGCGVGKSSCLGRKCDDDPSTCAAGEACIVSSSERQCATDARGKKCVSDGECGKGFLCAEGVCRLAACSERPSASRAHCGAGEVCAFAGGREAACVPSKEGKACTSMNQCGWGFTCVASTCTKMCSNDDDCKSGMVCGNSAEGYPVCK